jgi:hypothetical protein
MGRTVQLRSPMVKNRNNIIRVFYIPLVAEKLIRFLYIYVIGGAGLD